MGDTLWMEVDGKIERDPLDLSIMLRLENRLAGIARQLGVACLRDFYDYSEISRHYAGNAEDDEAGALPIQPVPEAWHDAPPAFAAVQAICEHVAQHGLEFKPDPSRAHWPRLLMRELAYCQQLLEYAVQHGRKVRLRMIP